MNNIRYKKCILSSKIEDNIKDKIVIVVLQLLDDSKNNEMRNGIIDSNLAKFRCNKARVIDIYDYNTEHKYNQAISMYKYKKIIYTRDNIVECDDYDENINKIYAPGIHYFKTVIGALLFIHNEHYVHNNGKLKKDALIWASANNDLFVVKYMCETINKRDYIELGSMRAKENNHKGIIEYLQHLII